MEALFPHLLFSSSYPTLVIHLQGWLVVEVLYRVKDILAVFGADWRSGEEVSNDILLARLYCDVDIEARESQ